MPIVLLSNIKIALNHPQLTFCHNISLTNQKKLALGTRMVIGLGCFSPLSSKERTIQGSIEKHYSLNGDNTVMPLSVGRRPKPDKDEPDLGQVDEL